MTIYYTKTEDINIDEKFIFKRIVDILKSLEIEDPDEIIDAFYHNRCYYIDNYFHLPWDIESYDLTHDSIEEIDSEFYNYVKNNLE